MVKLVSEIDGSRWAFKDNSQIYCQVVWLSDKREANMYHLIDENREEIKIEIGKCLKEC